MSLIYVNLFISFRPWIPMFTQLFVPLNYTFKDEIKFMIHRILLFGNITKSSYLFSPFSLWLFQSKESIDAAIGDALSKPWLPLPLGLKPPSTDSVMVELQRQGIPKIPPTCGWNPSIWRHYRQLDVPVWSASFFFLVFSFLFPCWFFLFIVLPSAPGNCFLFLFIWYVQEQLHLLYNTSAEANKFWSLCYKVWHLYDHKNIFKCWLFIAWFILVRFYSIF